ncbi:MAG: LacI family transcriptional regulator, partial [Ancrocorticia sp.]|nr:LacI family transcriptional regulator [Ancrocorticia sp.]
MARVTLADVADAVGVSAKSVSNVVNGTGWVGEETRKRILAAIDEMGYRPNLAARQLRGGTSGVLALAIPDLREPYFAEFVSRFVTAAQERALNALIVQTGGERTAEKRAIEGEGLPALDGVVVSPLQL